jgi:hypothetical protein
MRGIQSWGSIHQKGHVMSKRENEASKFRPSDRPLNDYEQEQKALRKNLERLNGWRERLPSRRTVRNRNSVAAGRAASVIPLSPVGAAFGFLPLKSHFRSHII